MQLRTLGERSATENYGRDGSRELGLGTLGCLTILNLNLKIKDKS